MKIGNIEVKVRKYRDGRWGYDDYSQGERHMVRLRTKQKAQARATDLAVLLANGRHDLMQIDASELAEFRKWKAGCNSNVTIAEACKAFVALKSTKSSRHVRSLRSDFVLFEEFMGATRPLGDILAPEIQRFLDSRDVGERRKFNLRAGIISLFRWARRMSYLPDRTTEAERVEPIEKTPGQANILLPAQMRILLDNVRDDYLPWLCVAAFAGVRSEEIAPDHKSKKSPLRWEDFDWQNQVITVRAATAKTKEEREVPILPNLAQWLAGYRNALGPVMGDAEQPSRRETSRLGQFIGGWKHNALRDSFCSYRAAITQNVPQVSYEMGNSISMVKRSYHRRQPIRAAQEWFDLWPATESKMVAFSMK
jgi:integrase